MMLVTALAVTAFGMWPGGTKSPNAHCFVAGTEAIAIVTGQGSIQSAPPAIDKPINEASGEVQGQPAYATNDVHSEKQWALQRAQDWQANLGDTQVVVAILDTGIDASHEDLNYKVVDGMNLTKSPTAADVQGHGTHIAGIIAATVNNEIGIAGVAPNARLLNVKVADDNGMVWPSTMAKGIIWATDNGAKIINLSMVVPTESAAIEEAVNYAWGKGVVLIAAAGNGIKSVPTFPAYYSKVIAVAATDEKDNLWEDSNFGEWVDVYAPGVEMYSTLPGNKYGYKSGTSMATAYISGIAVLVYDNVTDVDGDGFVNDEVTTALKAAFALQQ